MQRDDIIMPLEWIFLGPARVFAKTWPSSERSPAERAELCHFESGKAEMAGTWQAATGSGSHAVASTGCGAAHCGGGGGAAGCATYTVLRESLPGGPALTHDPAATAVAAATTPPPPARTGPAVDAAAADGHWAAGRPTVAFGRRCRRLLGLDPVPPLPSEGSSNTSSSSSSCTRSSALPTRPLGRKYCDVGGPPSSSSDGAGRAGSVARAAPRSRPRAAASASCRVYAQVGSRSITPPQPQRPTRPRPGRRCAWRSAPPP
mmetsp:Transcript_106230/g.327920  ORF Transcript_106230/g.327920 Transcript_106230/m.327920 type:complete len:261 (-) Transcript_106230:12-794(-)